MRQMLFHAAFILGVTLTTGVRETKEIEEAFSEQMREETFQAFRGIIDKAVAAGKINLGSHGEEGMQIFKELFDIDEIAQAAHAANLKEELEKLSQSKDEDSSAAIEALMQKKEMKAIDDLMVKHLAMTPGKLKKLSDSFEEALGSSAAKDSAGEGSKAHKITVAGFPDNIGTKDAPLNRKLFNGDYDQNLDVCFGGHPTYWKTDKSGDNQPVIYYCLKNATDSTVGEQWYITRAKTFNSNLKTKGLCSGFVSFEKGNILELVSGKGLRASSVFGAVQGDGEAFKHTQDNTDWMPNVGVSAVAEISGSPKDCSKDPTGQ